MNSEEVFKAFFNPDTPKFENENDVIRDGFINVSLMSEGKTLIVTTESNTVYKIEKRSDGIYISGNPTFCPEPIKTTIIGTDSNNLAGIGNIKEGKKIKILYTNLQNEEDSKNTTPIREMRFEN